MEIRTVLLTGSSGFLGKILRSHLESINMNVKTLGRRPEDDYCSDLSKGKLIDIDSFDLIVHCAGKAHSIPDSEIEREAFFNVNTLGTKTLLCQVEKAQQLPKCFVLISTVAVYGKDSGTLISEDTALLAKDPYGLSKIKAERLVLDWCSQNGVICTILRLPLIAGPNPPGNLHQMINGVKKGYYFNIAGGRAKKSMVLAHDVAALIPKVATIGGIYNLTDGVHPSFLQLSNIIAQQLSKARPLNIPFWLAKIMAIFGDCLGKNAPINSLKLKKIKSDLTFDDSKARVELGWSPTSVLDGFNIHQ